MKKNIVLLMLFSVLFNVRLISQINPLTNQLDTGWPDSKNVKSTETNNQDFSMLSGLICTPNSFWAYGNLSIDEFTISGSTITKTGLSIDKGNTVSGIAFCNNLDGNAFSPTMYSADLVTPEYFNGTQWKNSSVTTPEFILNPGGYGDYLYYVFYNQATGTREILRYTGTEFKHIYTYSPDIIPTIADLAVDDNGNVWTFTGKNDNKLHTDSLYQISPTGQLLNKYPFSFNSVHAYGYFILNNVFYIGLGTDNPDNPSSLVPITIENGVVKVGTAIPFTGEYSDLAACNTGNPLAVNDAKENEFVALYPNPAKNYVTIKTLSNSMDNAVLSICNLNGQKLIEVEVKELSTFGSYDLNLNSLHNGIYLLSVKLGMKQSTFKLVKVE